MEPLLLYISSASELMGHNTGPYELTNNSLRRFGQISEQIVIGSAQKKRATRFRKGELGLASLAFRFVSSLLFPPELSNQRNNL